MERVQGAMAEYCRCQAFVAKETKNRQAETEARGLALREATRALHEDMLSRGDTCVRVDDEDGAPPTYVRLRPTGGEPLLAADVVHALRSMRDDDLTADVAKKHGNCVPAMVADVLKRRLAETIKERKQRSGKTRVYASASKERGVDAAPAQGELLRRARAFLAAHGRSAETKRALRAVVAEPKKAIKATEPEVAELLAKEADAQQRIHVRAAEGEGVDTFLLKRKESRRTPRLGPKQFVAEVRGALDARGVRAYVAGEPVLTGEIVAALVSRVEALEPTPQESSRVLFTDVKAS